MPMYVTAGGNFFLQGPYRQSFSHRNSIPQECGLLLERLPSVILWFESCETWQHGLTETSVSCHITTRRHTPEDRDLKHIFIRSLRIVHKMSR
jgi:hypothetical protein